MERKRRCLGRHCVAWAALALVFLFSAGPALGANNYCSQSTAFPPFLVSSGVTPNLLLLIDNSASMNDLAYVGEQGYCYDDTYTSTLTYAGYFVPTTWYGYDFATGEFREKSDAQATALQGTADYTNTDVYIDFNADLSLAAFTAKGNFLNWASASKLDIQKKILTGGKYDETNTRLVGESRGCLGRRFVKKVAVFAPNHQQFFLTLAIRPPKTSEKADAADNTTRIEIYAVTSTGFDNSACQLAVDELQKESPNQGQIKVYIDGCMSYQNGHNAFSNVMGAFNHALYDCWYYSKSNEWPPGNGPIENIKPSCEAVYADQSYGILPPDIAPDNRGYVCYGDNDPVAGYVGRCWDPTLFTLKPNGGIDTPGWIADGDACIEQALMDYCQILEIPEVVDPSDQAGITGDFWNMPAVLIDSGVIAQLDEPKAVLKANIDTTGPSGLLQEFTEDLRIGAMVFNADGSDSECQMPDPHILYRCSDPDNKDGGRVISYIDSGPDHTTTLVSAINAINATSWTPLAEAMYNAIGYYTQNDSLRLNGDDFLIDGAHDPVLAYCQENHILLITEGASTADLSSTVSDFVSQTGQNDSDENDANGCPPMSGSTLLDDLTWYAKSGTGIYPSEPFDENKQNIKTHIVVAGTLRITGTDECSPNILLASAASNGGTTLYNATNPAQLESQLRAVLNEIRSGTSSGSAASVISSSRGGEGAVYQAVFWPSMNRVSNDPVKWVGEVHALLVDAYGDMYEDTNGNRTLDASDTKVVIYFDENTKDTRACDRALAADGTCPGTSKSFSEIRNLWGANEWLSEITDANVVLNRSTYISTEKKRYIFTWDDFNNDGIVGPTEVIPFTARADWSPPTLTVAGTRGPVPLDFGVRTSAEVNAIINWARGLDQSGMRSRQMEVDFDHDGTESTVTWRLGDVVHSTPVSVAIPAEGYHFLYRDGSYGQFVSHYNKRRHMVYFGGNDGMLHAVNGGFYDSSLKKFCLTEDCENESSAPELGTEMWAYVPYNVLPHLHCLADPDYEHSFYVDLRPRLFDVQVFDPTDGVHVNGWGTVLVCGMRFGGTKLAANSLDLNGDGSVDYPDDTRIFGSAYFILDVTDPESPPTLLAEMTYTGSEADMGYTTVIPTAVPMKTSTGTKWYLVFGNGPSTLDGRSTQNAKVAVVPFSRFVGSSPGNFRIPDALPTSASEMGRFDLSASPYGFVSDIITVDFDLNQYYKADTLYFGTVEGDWGGWSGKVYRLVTRKLDTNGAQVETLPSQWSTLLSPKSNPLPLIDAGQPVTAAPAVARDGEYYWVYFGTGRFLATNDKVDSALQSYYGIKEPIDCAGAFTWETVEKTGSVNTIAGAQGLLRVDQIKVESTASPLSAPLSCENETTDCLPPGVTTLGALETYIRGSGCTEDHDTGTDGWYRDFSLPRERNVGQATLLGGLLTYTSYQPFDDICKPEGLGYLYGLYYVTGTPWARPVFTNQLTGLTGLDPDGDTVLGSIPLGRGLAETPNLHVGRSEGVKAFVQTSTGAIVEIPERNLPLLNSKSGRVNWLEVTQ